jgi:hypothetical protein
MQVHVPPTSVIGCEVEDDVDAVDGLASQRLVEEIAL